MIFFLWLSQWINKILMKIFTPLLMCQWQHNDDTISRSIYYNYFFSNGSSNPPVPKKTVMLCPNRTNIKSKLIGIRALMSTVNYFISRNHFGTLIGLSRERGGETSAITQTMEGTWEGRWTGGCRCWGGEGAYGNPPLFLVEISCSISLRSPCSIAVNAELHLPNSAGR